MIQEERIRMQGDDGRAFLLTLAHNIVTEDLNEFLKNGVHIQVSFEGEPDLDTGVVRSIKKIQQIHGSIQ